MSDDVPKFAGKSELARYISPDQRLGGNRPAVAAFISNPMDDHLSVNSLEVEMLVEIAEYYRNEFQDGDGEVAICTHKIHKYNDVGRKSGATIQYNKSTSQWEFFKKHEFAPAYMHRPVRTHGSRSPSPSHCGVEFVANFDEIKEHNFARRMAKRPKYHSLKKIS